MACQCETQTETETAQNVSGHSAVESPIVQIDRNIHGFGSRARASSCPASSSSMPARPKSKPRTVDPPSAGQPQDANEQDDDYVPHPNLYAETEPPKPPVQFFIGEQVPNPTPSASQPQTSHPLDRDWWADAGNKMREKLEREKERRAVDSAAAWSGFTGTTHSVANANRVMHQAPYTPTTTGMQRPFQQCCQQQTHAMQNQHPHTHATTFPASHPHDTQQMPQAYTGNHWHQHGSFWQTAVDGGPPPFSWCTPPPQQCIGQHPFANTFQGNPFCRACMMSELQQNPQSDQPYDFDQHIGMHSPFPQQNPSLNQFNLDRSQSPEFHPASQQPLPVPASHQPFMQQCNQAPFAATFGNSSASQSQGIYVDRSSSNEFKPAEMQNASVTNPYASGHAFRPPDVTQPAQLFSPFANPRPVSSLPPQPYAYAPPSIPATGWQGNTPPVPNQVDHRDFMPTMNEDWEQRGQSGNFFGLQREHAFSQDFRQLHSAPAAFQYGQIPTSNQPCCGGGSGGMFGAGWGEDAGDNDAEPDLHGLFVPPASETFHSPVQTSGQQPMQRPNTLPNPQTFPMPLRPCLSPCIRAPNSFQQSCMHVLGRVLPNSFGGTFAGSQNPGGPGDHHGTGGYDHHQFPGPQPPPPLQPNRPLPPCPNPGYGPPPGGGNGGGNGGPWPPQPPQQPPNQCQGNGARNTGGKRWLPPPAFTPGATGSPSFKQWLWSLAAWSRLTSMPWQDRGLAVALSLGGRARSIATSMPHSILGLDTGLSILLQRLESDLGSELQDRTKSAASGFLRYRRAKGASASDHILSFEQSYQQAHDHGLVLSTPMLTMLLLETCGLTAAQEEWIMQSVGGSYEEYNLVRRALKRLPSLSSSGSFPAFADPPQEQSNNQAWPTIPEQGEYNPFNNSGGGLASPIAEDEDFYSEASDDYCSTGSGDDIEHMAVQQAWVQLRRFKKSTRKGSGKGKGKGKRRRKGGKGNGTFLLEDGTSYPVNVRNSSQDIPQGWEPAKWLARTPCPGCGSRYHRDCSQQASHKGSGKHSAGSGKRSGFATFLITSAAILSNAAAMFTNQCMPCESSTAYCVTNTSSTHPMPMFSENIGFDSYSLNESFCQNWELDTMPQICPSVHAITPVIPVYHLNAFMIAHAQEFTDFLKASDSTQSFCGCEPFGSEIRSLRFDTFLASTKVRFALMLDSGAPQSCTGMTWITRFLDAMKIGSSATWTEHHASLSGIGAGSAEVNWCVSTPIGIENFVPSIFKTQVLEGCGEHVPALLGLEPMTELQGVIDLRDLCFEVNNPQKQRCRLQCFSVSGHLMLPIDWGGTNCKMTKQDFISDPLGISLWYGNDEQTAVSSNLNVKPSESEKPLLPRFPCLVPMESQLKDAKLLPCFPMFAGTGNGTDCTRVHSDAHIPVFSMTSHVGSSLAVPQQPVIENPLPCFPMFSGQGIGTDYTRVYSDAHPPLSNSTVHSNPPPGLPQQPVAVSPSTGQGNSSQNLKISKTAAKVDDGNANTAPTVHSPAFFAFMTRTHAFMSKLARREKLLTNATYRRKYQPLPPDTPVPSVYIAPGKWMFWELWAGTAKLTRAMNKRGLTTGPPITKELGWDLSLKTHQAEIQRLFDEHEPEIIFAAPTCGPWSQSSTNMDSTIKGLIREEQVEAFKFYNHLVQQQFQANRYYDMEQPRSSELLHQPLCLDINHKYGGWDEVTCMCCHGLKDVDSGKPYMKQTTLRGNVRKRRAIKWCECKNGHELMQGTNRNGSLRTANAQDYTKLFCLRLADDYHDHLKAHKRIHLCFEECTTAAFPGEPNPSLRPRDPQLEAESDEEQLHARSDPYRVELTEEELAVEADKQEAEMKRARANRPGPIQPTFLEPTAKILPRPKLPVNVQALPPPPSAIVPTNPSDEPAAPERDIVIDDLPVAPELAEGQLQIAVKKPVLNDDRIVLASIASTGVQLANGGQRTFQTGPKIKLLQEIYGTPSNKVIRLAILTKKASMIAHPEPLVSRSLLSHFLHLSQDTSDVGWTNHGWREISELISISRALTRRPMWSIVIYALESEPGDLAQHMESTPLESIEERAALDKANTSSLPAVLKVLLDGDQPAQLRMLLMLHKRLQHKRADELRKILNQSGIPGRVLAMLDDAVSLCEQCRRWQVPHSNPATKGNITNRFNGLVYADLIFVSSPAMILLVMIDDCVRFTVVRNVSYRDFNSLTECVRQSWFSWFGPPETLRTDSESAFSHDSFGIWCEAVGVKRELVIAKDSHSMLGPLDRKVKIIRLAAPRIIDSLLEDSIRLSADDLASELQYNLNCQMSYGGITAYSCLFGCNPREFWSDESDSISSGDGRLPFYELMHVRQRSIAAFHLSLLRFRLERSLKSRPRTDLQQLYTIGQNVDIFLKAAKKDVEGWRGPGVIIGFLGEGRVTVRWQSSIRDLPMNLIRPHINILNTTALKQIKADNKPPVQALPSRASSSNEPRIEPQAIGPNVVDEASSAHLVFNHELVVARNCYEVYFNIDAADQLRGVYFDSLVSLASSLQMGNQQIHALDSHTTRQVFSRDAIRDNYTVFKIGQKFAQEHGIPHYAGLVFQSGRRFMSPMPGIVQMHACAWVNSEFIRVITVPGQQALDWIKEGIVNNENLHLLRSIIVLEARKEPPLLQTLLESSPQVEDGLPSEGRVREEWHSEDIIAPSEDIIVPSEEIDTDDPGPSVSQQGEHDVFIALNSTKHLQDITWLGSHPRHQELFLPVITTNTTSESYLDECYLVIANVYDHACPLYFPLNKDAREMTDAECSEYAPEVRTAQLKELSSWVKLNAGSPQKIAEYKAETGLDPVTSRWVRTFKRKAGKRIIKMRLVMKGFKETRQHKLITSSPTATRTSHRVVKTTSAARRWEIWSLDISAAFLRGFSFEELALHGHERQSCSFVPPAGLFALLAELDSQWAAAAKEPHLYCFRLHRAVYGLKDAPLLWFMKIRAFLVDKAQLRQSKHDSCLFMSIAPQNLQDDNIMFGHLDLLLSLHVDDNLVTGPTHKLQKLYEELMIAFEDISIEKNHFRHFGLDVWRDPVLHNVYSCQKDYLGQLEPVVLPTGRKSKDDKADSVLITSYRSLVAGLAWVGVTYAPALTAGSLFQTYLPFPTLGHCTQLNDVLKQLKEQYRPLIYRSDIKLPLRLISIVDSSLGNASKYSQNGFYTLLCNKSSQHVCGGCNQIAFKSSKSKRVASSTSHAETLASMSGLEETSFIQTWLLELQFPLLSSAELINAKSEWLVPIVAIGDCKDAFDMFTKPAFPTPVNRALTLYVHAIREYYEKKRVEAFVWIDTRDNVSNALTKFSQSGLLELDGLISFYTTASWEPKFPFRWHGEELVDPEPYLSHVFNSPPAPTKVMADKAIEISSEDPTDIYKQGSSKDDEE